MNANSSQIGAFVVPKIGTVPAAPVAGTRNGTGIDRLALNASSVVVAQYVGATTGAPTSFTVDCKLQDSADNSAWADFVPPGGSASLTQIVAASSVGEKDFDLTTARQYVRTVETVAFVGGTAPTVGVCATLTFGGGTSLPM